MSASPWFIVAMVRVGILRLFQGRRKWKPEKYEGWSCARLTSVEIEENTGNELLQGKLMTSHKVVSNRVTILCLCKTENSRDSSFNLMLTLLMVQDLTVLPDSTAHSSILLLTKDGRASPPLKISAIDRIDDSFWILLLAFKKWK